MHARRYIGFCIHFHAKTFQILYIPVRATMITDANSVFDVVAGVDKFLVDIGMDMFLIVFL